MRVRLRTDTIALSYSNSVAEAASQAPFLAHPYLRRPRQTWPSAFPTAFGNEPVASTRSPGDVLTGTVPALSGDSAPLQERGPPPPRRRPLPALPPGRSVGSSRVRSPQAPLIRHQTPSGCLAPGCCYKNVFLLTSRLQVFAVGVSQCSSRLDVASVLLRASLYRYLRRYF